ncbi:uncharacterized protein ACBT44_002158 isoform 2-T2 [Syngnathus typhle]
MINTGSLQKTFLLAAVLVALVELGHGQGKPTECCKKVSTKEITEEVIGLRVDRYAQLPCLPAVIFYTKNGDYCAHARAPWVRQKIEAIRKAAAAAAQALTTSPQSESSLLTILTSTASAPSSSPPSSSSSSPSSPPLSSSTFSPRLRPTIH